MNKDYKKTIAAVFLLSALLINACSTENGFSSTDKNSCSSDSECVPASCCHPAETVNKIYAPDCKGIFCTQVCSGPLDCGAGVPACISHKCSIKPGSTKNTGAGIY